MHFFRVLSSLSLLFGTHASSLGSRQMAAHPLDVRDLIDVCASINTDLLSDLLGNGNPAGVIDVCLCLSALPVFLETNVVALLAVDILGTQVVTDLLTNLILTDAPNSHCNYPDHTVPTCIGENPCGFTCKDGFTAFPPSNPTACVCAAPKAVCNGQCGPITACPSSGTTPQKRWVGSGSCTERPGYAACGVYGGGARAWECVNTAHDLESCGGCALPLTPFSPIGQDCTAIPGVADVACHSGKCKVRRCMSGYVQSHDGTSCISKNDRISQPHVTTPEDDNEFMQAIRYGLEHIALQKN